MAINKEQMKGAAIFGTTGALIGTIVAGPAGAWAGAKLGAVIGAKLADD